MEMIYKNCISLTACPTNAHGAFGGLRPQNVCAPKLSLPFPAHLIDFKIHFCRGKFFGGWVGSPKSQEGQDTPQYEAYALASARRRLLAKG